MIKTIISKLFNIYKENAQIIIIFLGIKFKFKYSNINQLEEVCCIQNLQKIKRTNTLFPHPIGIVIHPEANIGNNCTIFQNVTIGQGKLINNTCIPTILDNVTIYPNSVIIGGITIGKNSIVGAGSIVINDVPENTIVAGNPAKIIKYLK